MFADRKVGACLLLSPLHIIDNAVLFAGRKVKSKIGEREIRPHNILLIKWINTSPSTMFSIQWHNEILSSVHYCVNIYCCIFFHCEVIFMDLTVISVIQQNEFSFCFGLFFPGIESFDSTPASRTSLLYPFKQIPVSDYRYINCKTAKLVSHFWGCHSLSARHKKEHSVNKLCLKRVFLILSAIMQCTSVESIDVTEEHIDSVFMVEGRS